MDDASIIELYWRREDRAIAETDAIYGRFCFSITRNILFDRQDWEHGDALFTILNAANGSMIAPVNSNMILG